MKQRLTDTAIKALKPKKAVYRVTDGGGLCIEITAKGEKLWRYRFRINGKASMMSLGRYPDTTLEQARMERTKQREHAQKGRSPVRERQLSALRGADEAARTFRAVAEEWMREDGRHWSAGYARQVRARLEGDAYQHLGALPISAVTPADILAVLDLVAARSPTQAKLVKTWIGGVFRYAVKRLVVEFDPTWPLRRSVRTPQVRHHPGIPANRLGTFLRALESIPAMAGVRTALRVLTLTVLRANELVGAEWTEIDIDAGRWVIAPERMKLRRPHTVMLSRQVVELLRATKVTAGAFPHVFPARSDLTKALSYDGLRDAFKRAANAAGVEATPHGVRSTFSTWANELGADSRVIELCLAHSESDKIKASYDHAERLRARAALMQEWADYCDTMRVGADVIPLQRKAS